METEHIPIEMARAYLLGALADEDASAVEQMYFAGRPCLLEMQAAERRLIDDYLDGLLAPDERRQFQARYLGTPVLKKLVDEARRGRESTEDRGRPRPWWASLAWAAAVLCFAAVCVWVLRGRHEQAPNIAFRSTPVPSLAAVTLRLAPGVNKGTSAQNARIPLPPERTPVRLIAELPGLRAPVECAARLSIVGADGGWTNVWSGKPTRTESGESGQELVVPLGPSTLHPGDYVLEVAMPDGRVRETYLFHVSPSQ